MEPTEQQAEDAAKVLTAWIEKNPGRLRPTETQRVKWKALLFVPHNAFHRLIREPK